VLARKNDLSITAAVDAAVAELLRRRNLLMTQNNILFITHGCHPCHDILALKRCSKMDGDGCGMQCIGRRTCNNKPPKTHIS